MRISLPEQVWIDVEPASFGSRALAFVFDFIIRWTFVLVFLYLLSLFTSLLEFSLGGLFEKGMEAFKNSDQLVYAIFIIVLAMIEFSYPIFFEVFKAGVSPGKKALGLRVVDERGLPVTFRASFLRTVLIAMDFLPGLGLCAFISMMLSKNSQRLGDLVAKTMVVHQTQEVSAIALNSETVKEKAPIVLPIEAYNILERYLRRRIDLTSNAREATSTALLAKIKDLSSELPPQTNASIDEKEEFLERLYKSSQPGKLKTMELDRPSAVERKGLDWDGVKAQLAEVEGKFEELKDPSKQQSAQSLFNIAETYQKLCQRYGQLSTFYPDTAEARQASHLVRDGRRLIYGKRLSALEGAKENLFQRTPKAFHKIRMHCLLSFSLGILGAALAALLVQINPNLSWHFLSEDVVKDLVSGNIWTERIKGMSTVAASGIMTNNIKVTLSAFALGITGGVGTAIIIVFNGVHLGGIFSSLSLYNMSQPLLNFIAAHGPLELSVIFVAGGCGFFLGDSLLNPGPLSRKQALQNNARVVVDLIFFNAICLIIAGLVEGYISPYEQIPVSLKASLGILLGIFYWIFLFAGPPQPRSPRPLSLRGSP